MFVWEGTSVYTAGGFVFVVGVLIALVGIFKKEK